MTNFVNTFIAQRRYGNLDNTINGAQLHSDSSVFYYDIQPDDIASFEAWANAEFVNDDGESIIDNIIYNFGA